MQLNKLDISILFEAKSIKDVWNSWQNKLNGYSMGAGVTRTKKAIEKTKNRIDRTASREKLNILNRMLSLQKQLLGLYDKGSRITKDRNFDKKKSQIFNIAMKINDIEEDIFKLRKRHYVYRR